MRSNPTLQYTFLAGATVVLGDLENLLGQFAENYLMADEFPLDHAALCVDQALRRRARRHRQHRGAIPAAGVGAVVVWAAGRAEFRHAGDFE